MRTTFSILAGLLAATAITTSAQSAELRMSWWGGDSVTRRHKLHLRFAGRNTGTQSVQNIQVGVDTLQK